MEIVLQWLDDLDDLVYAGALTSERTRRGMLGVGLAASLLCAAASPAWLPLPLAAISLASVIVWMAGAAAALAGRRLARSHA